MCYNGGMNFNILSFETDATEKTGFLINRPGGKNQYVFARFRTPTVIQDSASSELRRPDACILFSPNKRQMYSSPSHDLVHDYVTFKVSNGLFFEQIGFKTDTVFYPSSYKLLDETLSVMQSDSFFSAIARSEAINSALTRLFISLAQDMYLKSAGETLPAAESFFYLRNDMFLHPQEYTVKDMAQKMHFSLPYFSMRYKQLFGISPMRDLTEAKLSLAKRLLADGQHPQEISEYLNFDSLPNFYNWFKKNAGMTPNNFLLETRRQST